MAEKNRSIADRLAKNNIIDTAWLVGSIVIILVCVWYIHDKNALIFSIGGTLLVYWLRFTIARDSLMKLMDKLIYNELKDFQEISVKVLKLSEKQKQLTLRYTQLLDNVLQSTKTFNNNAIKTQTKTQGISALAQDVYSASDKEAKTLYDNIGSMQNLKHKVQNIAELIIELTDYIKQIGATVTVVENISEQTNMLALNAAVEAARAGEYGKGFSVVAGEIRKLADESKQATNKITALVSEIEQTTSSTIIATEDSTREIEITVQTSDNISSNVNGLVDRIKELGNQLREITDSTINQQAITTEILAAIEDMQKGIDETLNTLEENIQNIREFSEISSSIKEIIAD
ncbi:hypothetical protein II906_09920 [bacterium]|nr:hypothetical protein [bacterium]